jgi:hypothetical protein
LLGGAKKTWKERWVVLKDKCIYYFKHKEDESPCGIIPLPGVLARRLDLRYVEVEIVCVSIADR